MRFQVGIAGYKDPTYDALIGLVAGTIGAFGSGLLSGIVLTQGMDIPLRNQFAKENSCNVTFRPVSCALT